MNPYGIGPSILQSIVSICAGFKAVRRVILYGSRARGSHREGSDIDIAIDAPDMSAKEFSQLWNLLDDLPIVYSLDIVHIQSLKNRILLDAIEQEGAVIFSAILS